MCPFHGVESGAARLVGLNVERLTLQTFVASGTLAGVAGVLLIAKNGNASPQTGAGFMLLAISAALLGATAIKPGRFNVIGTLVAISVPRVQRQRAHAGWRGRLDQ
ncbi:hypothetical protein CH267_00380 [Rhodococcus sp. 06-621-2]|nr:hypothetical protein [Rhodococcus sp. 06-621-2]OZC62844.1 hypothetical protein CH267_00380 [Rhodococcus sp. 06-621-2]